METLAPVPSPILPFSADDLCGLLPTVWGGVLFANDEKRLVKGIRVWESWRDGMNTQQVARTVSNQANEERPPLLPVSGNSQETAAADSATAPLSASGFVGSAKPAKRRFDQVEVIDLCDDFP